MFEHILSPQHPQDDGETPLNKTGNDASSRELSVTKALPAAVEQEEFVLHYQPQYDTVSWQIRGFEALLRWNHPELGLVSPVEFIPAAEKSGIIVQLGEWVIREACRKNKEIHAQGFTRSVISVNISALQLKDVKFADSVKQILRETGLEGKYLEIELTESAMIQNFDTSEAILNELRDTGVRIALDDFGTGYSSLSYLKKLPIQNVKIDRSFVQNLCSEPKGKVIVESIVAMVHKLGLGVVAEGIETEEQLDFVKSFGCECVQGYLLSKPLPEAELRYVIPPVHSGAGTV
jgi:EAL domain-containing protein (putative c-di-GMP-specific phosphodiesterase class I)